MSAPSVPHRSGYLTADKQLLGAAGTYHVMSELSARGFHASCTFGNAPHVDILVSSPTGARSIAIQVKTTSHAKRMRGREKQGKHVGELQWPLGAKAAKANLADLFVVFVDFDKYSAVPATECYVVPSTFLFTFCRAWVDKVTMVRFHVAPDRLEEFRGAWHLIHKALASAPALTPTTPVVDLS